MDTFDELGLFSKESRIEEMRSYVARLNEAAEAYYNGRGELMTDFEWDALFDKVKALEAETGVILEDSPTNNVSADDVAGQKEAHEFPALSLAKTKKVSEVARWAEGRPIWLSWKLDGLTLVATYDNGQLTKVVTRGDGHIGTNITHLAEGISGIPKGISYKGHLVLRGEAVISYEDFEAFLSESGEDFANPRNLAAGSLTLKSAAELKPRKVQWVPFTLVYANDAAVSWGARMNLLSELGFNTVDRELIENPSEESLHAAVERWTEKVTTRKNPFPVDGLVVCYDDTEYASTGSVTGHHATRAGFAFKWQDETAATRLDHVEWSCSVGSITPVAVFEPVDLEGTTVKRASLCNLSECERLGIGGKGTALLVIKANKIIPKVVQITNKEGEFEIPRTCPVCGAPTEIVESESGTRKLQCSDSHCPARELAKYRRFVSREGLDVDGLAGETISKFVNLGWIKSVADIYRLVDHKDEIASLDGFGTRSAEKIVASIEAARNRDAAHFLVALSIPMCGRDVSKRLTESMAFTELLAMVDDPLAEEKLASIDGIGPVKAQSFVGWFRDGANRALVDGLLGEVKVADTERVSAGGKCDGLVFVITGDVHHYANRDAFKAYVESQGGKVAGSVSSKTDFLVNNDLDSPSSKNRKAKELGIEIISEADFVSRFGDNAD